MIPYKKQLSSLTKMRKNSKKRKHLPIISKRDGSEVKNFSAICLQY